MRTLTASLKIALPLMLIIDPAIGQWSDNPQVNTPVVTVARDQTSPRMISDGLGGMITVWQDSRDSATTGTDIYAKRLDQNGLTKWTVALSKASGDQNLPSIIADGQGGAIAVWTDRRGGGADIFAQRINNLGGILWKLNGIEICTDAGDQTDVALASDGLGGATFSWVDFRTPASGSDIYAQRISPGGITQWTLNGITVCAATGDQAQPRLTGDGFGGAIVVWQDGRGGVNTDIYAQHLETTGALSWGTNGIVITAAAGRQRNPQVIPDDEQGAFIVWEDSRSGSSDVYAHRIDASGSLHVGWPAAGLPVCTVAGEQSMPAIAGTGQTGAIIVWQDTRNVEEDLFAQKLDGAGTALWAPGGISVTSAPEKQIFPAITGDGFGGAIVGWQDNRNGNEDIYAQSISAGGSPEWTPGGVAVSSEPHGQEIPAIVGNGSRGAILVWQDLRAVTNYDVYTQIINRAGILGLISIGGVVFNDAGDDGSYDNTDAGLAGWRVTLGGAASAVDTTDSLGAYTFTNLSPGNYSIKVEDRTGWKHTYPNATGDSTVALDSAIGQVNFGNFELATISGRIYDDRNENGIVDAGEPSFTQSQRWRVKLSGAASREMDTDNGGNYRFTGLASGEYALTVVQQILWFQTFPVDTPRPIVAHGQDTVIHFGFFRLGQINGQVVTDQIADSVLDDGDRLKPLGGWTVRLHKGGVFQAQSVTAGNGNYSFGNLHVGSYVVSESTQAGWVQTVPSAGYAESITAGAQTRNNRDFGNFKTGSISGNLHFDDEADSSLAGDAGLSGWTVRLLDTGGVILQTTLANGSGFYSFNHLMPGIYTVSESLQTGWSQTYPKPPAPPEPQNKDTMVVIPATSGLAEDPRMYRTTIDSSGWSRPRRSFGNFRRGQIGGTVFLDLNGDGGKDPGDRGLSGWRLQLSGKDASGKPVTGECTTDSFGGYLFANIAGGDYTVKLIRQTGWRITRPTTADLYAVRVNVGAIVSGRDFGTRLAGSLHGQVYLDVLGDGEKTEDDTGLPGRKMLLLKPGSGWVLDSTLTDSEGMFIFDTLQPGLYRVAQKMEPGWKNIVPPPPVHLRDIEETQDFRIANFQFGTIGGRVFDDVNGDGLNSGEPAIAGCTLLLNLVLTDTTDSLVARAVTDGSGTYLFPGLERGRYRVAVRKPIGWKQTTSPSAFLDSITSSGQSISGPDFGGYHWSSVTGSIFLDVNGNGSMDAGEGTLADRSVFLSAGGGGPVIDSTRTAANGMYQFTGLPGGTFVITTNPPPGHYQTVPDSSGGHIVTFESPPAESTHIDFGYYPGTMGGTLFNDQNGDGVRDAGEGRLAGWSVYLSGHAAAAAVTDSSGRYGFSGLRPGGYNIEAEHRTGWVHTHPDSTGRRTAVLDSVTTGRADLDIGNFQLISIGGQMFEDLNRNGTRDLGEPPMANRGVLLTGGTAPVNALTDIGGNYLFTGIRGGQYTVAQQTPVGYDRSFPPFPGVHPVAALSGEPATGRNFGNYQTLPNTITVRCFRDNDGLFTTSADLIGKPWNLRLYRGSVSSGNLVPPSITSVSGIYFTNLTPDTYIAVMADSSGWIHLGKIVNGVPFAGSHTADTMQLTAGGTHQVNMVVFRPNSLLVRALSDTDGSFTTVNDRDTLPWDLSVYRKFIAPANLVASASAAESLFIDYLGNDTYVAVRGDSAGWKQIGSIPGGAGGTGFHSVALSGGSSASVEFVSTQVGNLTARAWYDADGSHATTSDRAPLRWRLRIYRGSVLPSNLIADDSTETLGVSDLAPGTYVVTQSDRHGGAAWNHIGTIVDGAPDSTIKNFSTTVTIAGGGNRSIEFLNFDPRRRKSWTAGEDGLWNNALNWSPPFIPRTIDTVAIAPTALACVPEIPGGLSLPSLIVETGSALRIRGVDTIRGDIRVDGTLAANDTAPAVIIVGRNWLGDGTFLPGVSTLRFTGGATHTTGGLMVYDLHLDTNNTGQPWNLGAHGNLTVINTARGPGDLDMIDDTLHILSDEGGAISDSIRIVGGSIRRTIDASTPGIRYRFERDSTYILFPDTGGIPSSVTMRSYPATLPSAFGDAWETIGVNPRRETGSVVVDSVHHISRFKVLTLGRIIGGNPTPTIKRVYSIGADVDSGFTATISLRYEPSESIGTPMPDSLLVLCMKFAVRESVSGGWNLVSVGAKPDDFRKNVVFPGAVSGAVAFDPVAGAYAARDTLRTGEGYWMKFGADTIATIVGSMLLDDTVTLHRGWNLIGSLSQTVPTSGVGFLPPNLGHGEFFGFNRGYGAAQVLDPMRAYWVNVSDTGRLVLHASGAGASPKPAGMPAIPLTAGEPGTITIADADGCRQLLRFGMGPSPVPDRYLLPPPGPAGVLDARFGNQKMLEYYSGSPDSAESFDILVNTLHYPVTISWELAYEPGTRISMHAWAPDGPGVRGGPDGGVTMRARGTFSVTDRSVNRVRIRVESLSSLPESFALRQCYPNPFNPTTTIAYELPSPALVTLTVYDILGREVAVLLDGVQKEAGRFSTLFDATGRASGVYFYRMTARGNAAVFDNVKKMLLLK